MATNLEKADIHVDRAEQVDEYAHGEASSAMALQSIARSLLQLCRVLAPPTAETSPPEPDATREAEELRHPPSYGEFTQGDLALGAVRYALGRHVVEQMQRAFQHGVGRGRFEERCDARRREREKEEKSIDPRTLPGRQDPHDARSKP